MGHRELLIVVGISPVLMAMNGIDVSMMLVGKDRGFMLTHVFFVFFYVEP